MPSSVIGALRVTLGLDTAEFTSSAAKAETRAEQLGTKIGNALAKPITGAIALTGAIGTLASALALTEFTAAAKRAFDFTDAIQDLSDRTGASTKIIQQFRYAAQLSGSSVEVADQALEKFARTQGLAQAGGDAQVKLFRSLGVTSTDFDTALRQTMDGIAKLPTVQQRAAVGFQLFGKSSATLTNLLGQGTEGFDMLAQKASELGIVLDKDLIANAGKANDTLDTTKMILDAQFANAVAGNADAIVSLANAFIKAGAAAANFFASIPNKGNLFDLAHPNLSRVSSLVRGVDPAAERQQAFSDLLGNKAGRQALFDRNRAQRAALARGETGELGAAGTGIANNPQAIAAERARLAAERQQIVNAQRASRRPAAVTPPPSGRIPTTGNAEGASAARKAATDAAAAARKREHDEKQARENERRYQAELSRAEEDRLSAVADLTMNQEDRVQIERTLNDTERKGRLEQIATDEHLTDAQKKKLSEVTEEVYGLRQNLINQRAEEEMARERLALASARNENEQDILSAQAGLANTVKERRELELKILDLQFSQLRATQEAVLASQTSTDSEKQIARERLGVLGTLQGLGRDRIKKENQGPLAQYLDGIPKTADEMNQALEGIQTQGLDSLIDGIAKARGSFKDLAATVQSVANDIISSLLKIGLQKGVAALLGSLLGGGRGSVRGLADGINWNSFTPDSSGLNLSGARAGGGPVVGGKNYLVGEMGPEIFTAPHSGQIVANDDIPMGGRNVVYQNITIPGGVDLMTRTEGYRVAGAVKDATMAAIDDRNRRRG